ncbi:Protein CBG14497 [Caenorhabditis briggsae]|nr:Protein CBG14497 [Caenorhabditis briggsae]CAP32999.2 Protein CBG14497 [Caenorhabditis briggsae]
MMNGRAVRSVLIRNNRQENGSVDHVPRSIQFDESSEEYRCLCNCFHVKTGAFIIGCAHVLMILFFLIHSLFVYFQHDGRLQQARGVKENYVFGSFLAEMIGLGLGIFAVFLLFVALSRNSALLVVPHLVMQVIAILCFILVLVSGTIALCTDSAVFYRLINAAPFMEHPNNNTVALDTGTMVRIYSLMIVYAISLALEFWFIVVIYNCNRYLDERSDYMKYCLAFSTPMKTLSAR